MYTRSPYTESFQTAADASRKQVVTNTASFENADSQLQGAMKGVTPDIKSMPEYASFTGKYEALQKTVSGMPQKLRVIDDWVKDVTTSGTASQSDLSRVQTEYNSLSQSYGQVTASVNLLTGELERMQNVARAQKMQQDALKQFRRR
jgi:hypothetical protein